MNLDKNRSGLRLQDVLVGCAFAAVLTLVNLLLGLPSGHLTYLPYDPIGAVMLAQSLPDNWFPLVMAPFVQNSGVWVGLLAASLKIIGDALWVPYLMTFWQSAVMLTLAVWLGRYYLGFRGVLLFALATALLPPFGHELVTPVRELLGGTIVSDVFWPVTGDETGWQCWICEILKTDLLGGSFVAISIALLAIEPSKLSVFRIFLSGVAISLAVLTKGHAAIIYLGGWGAAVLVIGLLLGERGPRFARRSYWALFFGLAPLLGAWWWFGAANFATAYLRDSFLHPLFGSDAFLKPEVGTFEYIVGFAPTMVGFGAQVLLVMSILAILFGRANIMAGLRAAAPFFVAVGVMMLPIFLSPFGKNFTMTLPLYTTLWAGLMVFTGVLIASWKRDAAQPVVVWVAVGLFGALALSGALAAIQANKNNPTVAEIRHDRETLRDIAEAIVESGAKTVLTPLAHTGIPAIIIFEATKVADARDLPVARIFNTNWNVAGGEDARQAGREHMNSFDAVLVVPGGPEKFYFLGPYQSHVYALTEEVVDAADSPFVLKNEFRVGPTSSPYVYFLAGPQEMVIRLYVRSELAAK